MAKPTFIQKLIKRYNEFQQIRPKYTIKNLYCGKIEGYFDNSTLDEDKFVKKTIKDFVIFYKQSNGSLIHVKSNLPIDDESVVDNTSSRFASQLQSFEDVYGDGFAFLGLTYKSKISREFIVSLEDAANEKVKHAENNTL